MTLMDTRLSFFLQVLPDPARCGEIRQRSRRCLHKTLQQGVDGIEYTVMTASSSIAISLKLVSHLAKPVEKP
jgi:hypothetical protein